MPDSGEFALLILGVVLILAGMAGNKIKAFNLEIPAFAGKNQKIVLFGSGTLFTLAALWLILSPSLPPVQIPASAETVTVTSDQPQATNLPAKSSQLPVIQQGSVPATQQIKLNQTVSGTLYYNEGGEWVFSQGPAKINIILDTGPYGESLIMIFDPTGVQREYVDA